MIRGTLPQLANIGLPLAIELRSEALAKSNRPHHLLDRAGLKVRASVGSRKIVAQAHPTELDTLSERVLNRETSPRSRREISAIESLSLWDPITDAMGVGDAAESVTLLREFERADRPIVLELFPWLAPETRVEHDSTLAQYLAQIGFSIEYVSKTGRLALYTRADRISVEGLRRLAGIRSIYAAPQYAAAYPDSDIISVGIPEIGAPEPQSPLVGVLDSGIDSDLLGTWLAGADRYVIPRDEDRNHGTFVAGLIANSRSLNGDDSRFPSDRCRVFDAQIMPRGQLWEHELMNRIEEAVEKHGDSIKVWNCSFGTTQDRAPGSYSPFAAFMDELANHKGILFVQAAGNYPTNPPRTWPPVGTHQDALRSPGEAVNSVTVGALNHVAGAVTGVGHPASYSRRGPGLDGVVKPDVCHYSGDVDVTGDYSHTGVLSYAAGGGIRRGVGTSYATPIVSATAASVAESLSAPEMRQFSSPLLTRALLVHAARQRSPSSDAHRSYYGNGVPPSASEVLSDPFETFTTMYLVKFTSAGEWMKRNFPIPSCLRVNGILRGEVFVTVAQDAILDASFDRECIRTSVSSQLGPVVLHENGQPPTVDSQVPVEASSRGWEADLVDRGKWSPIRTYHKRWPRGTQSGEGEWGLKLSLLERLEALKRPVEVAVLVTFRGIDPNLPVRADGARALQSAGHATQEVTATARLRIQGPTS
ncbi:S8 family peptidase [Promicromonospora aerolata]|uniref:S8 family peptidase n=1 Tax=Promicromonospora aerolata TaxID=195749 RepID=A0ABW4VDS3_9MICO